MSESDKLVQYIPAAYYQQLLPDLSFDHFQSFATNAYPVQGQALEIITTHLWLGYLCCRGKFDEVLSIIRNTNEPRRSRYVNERSNEFWSGNLLHIVLYWNTDERAFEMYKTLRELGADPIEDMYGNYPWENKARIWTAPTLRNIFGNRYQSEFDDLYEKIIQWEITYLQQ